MSTVFHAFEASEADPARCARAMPSGVCRRTRAAHRKDVRKRGKVDRHRSKADRHKNRPKKADQALVFFDTEGKGSGADHRLIYGAAVDATGRVLLEVEGQESSGSPLRSLAGGTKRRESDPEVAPASTSTPALQPPPEVWLDALLEIGRLSKQRSCFAYGFGYDRTKMLEGLPAETLYMLTRREERPLGLAGKGSEKARQPKPLYWGDYQIDLQGTRFSVAKLRRDERGLPRLNAKGRRTYDRMTVWDILKFFQCPFVEALDAWRRKTETVRRKPENLESLLFVPEKALALMRRMKKKRADFDRMPWERVKEYCQAECRYGAALVRELVTACSRIGVTLRRFDGAGSISDALMRLHQVGEHMSAKSVCPLLLDSVKRRALQHAIMSAFAGGRFEATYCGIQRGKVYAKDIASAYPYAMYLHPCLACGTWERVSGSSRGIDHAIEIGDLALVHVKTVGRDANQSLGSLHHRDADGNITFPISNQTWTWKHEYLAARDGMGDRCKVLEAYVYRTPCDHRPFKFMGELYLERLRIGKEGRGTAMKLGYNGCAGKTMQRVGSHKWQEYVWAGNTTSRTRAMLLWAISRFRDQWKVCYLATDSVFALEDVAFPEPEETGTGEARAKHGKVELGAWEPGKHVYDGMVFVRPGIAFPLNATEEQLKEVKARGISKSVLLESVPEITSLLASQQGIGGEIPALEMSRRIFAGMKMSTTKRGRGALATYHATENYGTWYEQAFSVKLTAQPKRMARLPGEDGMLLPWPDISGKLGEGPSGPSLAYGATKVSEEARALQELQDLLLEQPDLDSADFRE